VRIERAVSLLTLFTIYFIPIFGIIDFLISISVLPGVPGRGRPDHPFPQMIVAKELLALLIFSLLLILTLKRMRIRYSSFIVFAVVGTITIYTDSLVTLIAGMRQSISFVYIIAGVVMMEYYAKMNIDGRKIFVNALKLVMISEFVFVVLQMQLMPAYEGEGLLGSRAIGSFNNPNTLGAFGALSFLLLLMFKDSVERVSKIYYIISGIIVFSAGSRLAIIIYIIVFASLLINKFKKNSKLMVSFIAVILVFLSLSYINILANKPVGISIVEGARAYNLVNYFLSMDFITILIGQGWGKMTSWFFTLTGGSYTNVDGFMRLDSFYAAMIAQIGLIGLFIMLLFTFYIFYQGGRKGIYLFLIFWMMSAQVNILEYYPINFMLFIALGVLHFEYQQRNAYQVIQQRMVLN
jgi:hypothetical protein